MDLSKFSFKHFRNCCVELTNGDYPLSKKREAAISSIIRPEFIKHVPIYLNKEVSQVLDNYSKPRMSSFQSSCGKHSSSL